MLLELLSGVLLLFVRPPTIPAWAVRAGVGLLVIVWASTWLLQVPIHGKLSRGLDRGVCKTLSATNWIRTVSWTARAVLLAAMTAAGRF